METKHYAVLAVVLTNLFNYGCTEVDSADLKTHGMYAKYTAVDNGSSVTVEAKLTTGPLSLDTINLSSGDDFYATFSGVTKKLSESHSFLGEYIYEAVFNTSGANEQVTIDFQRLNEVSAPNSYVTLPDAFTLTGPTSGTAYSISNNSSIDVSWTPTSSSRMRIEFSTSCQTSIGSTISIKSSHSISSDSGSYSTNIGTMLQAATAGEDPPVTITNCGNMDIDVTRSNSGVVDNAFGKGGYFSGEEKRSTYIVVNP